MESSRSPQQEVETLEASLREREKELARSKAAERERVSHLTVTAVGLGNPRLSHEIDD